MLAGANEGLEPLCGGEVVARHQDSLGLADDVAGLVSLVESIDLLGEGEGEGDGGAAGEEETDLFGLIVEGVGTACIEIEGAEVVAVDVELEGQHAVGGPAREQGPAQLGGHVGNPGGLVLLDGVEAGPLSDFGLDGVDCSGRGLDGCLRGDKASVDDHVDGGGVVEAGIRRTAEATTSASIWSVSPWAWRQRLLAEVVVFGPDRGMIHDQQKWVGLTRHVLRCS